MREGTPLGHPEFLLGQEVEEQVSPQHGRGWHEGMYVSRTGNSKRRERGEAEDRAPSDPGLRVHRDTMMFCHA